MTANNTQVNILDGMQNMAMLLLDLRSRMALTSQMWTNESVGSLVDADIQTLATFAGVTAAEALGVKQVFDVLVTALGDPGTAGTNAYKLLKMANNIP